MRPAPSARSRQVTASLQAALAIFLPAGAAACARDPEASGEGAGNNSAAPSGPAGEATGPVPARVQEPAPSPAPAAQPAAANADMLTLEGLGGLRIGEPVPAGSTWASRGAQVPGGCRTISSPDHPGVHAIVEDGRVRRITAGQRSRVRLAEGIGVGASEADVRKWFAGFRAEPHKYADAPAKYLTAPNAAGGSAALRFEIGSDGRVSAIHVGTMPVLGYVEGCS